MAVDFLAGSPVVVPYNPLLPTMPQNINMLSNFHQRITQPVNHFLPMVGDKQVCLEGRCFLGRFTPFG